MCPNTAPARAASWRLALAAGLIALAGCGDTPAPTAADPDLARQTLDRALGSWSEGKSVDDAKSASPPILVSEPKWARGDRLKKFDVKSDGKPSGAERVFTVTIWTVDGKGKEATETVDYRVGTTPVFTVFRAMF
jgi:hypothetical protein